MNKIKLTSLLLILSLLFLSALTMMKARIQVKKEVAMGKLKSIRQSIRFNTLPIGLEENTLMPKTSFLLAQMPTQ